MTTDTAFDLAAAQEEEKNISEASHLLWKTRAETPIGSYGFEKIDRARDYLRFQQSFVTRAIADYFKEEA